MKQIILMGLILLISFSVLAQSPGYLGRHMPPNGTAVYNSRASVPGYNNDMTVQFVKGQELEQAQALLTHVDGFSFGDQRVTLEAASWEDYPDEHAKGVVYRIIDEYSARARSLAVKIWKIGKSGQFKLEWHLVNITQPKEFKVSLVKLRQIGCDDCLQVSGRGKHALTFYFSREYLERIMKLKEEVAER